MLTSLSLIGLIQKSEFVRLLGHIILLFGSRGCHGLRGLLFSHLAVNLNIISFVRRSGSFVCFFHLTATLTESHILMYAVGAFSGHFFIKIWRFVVNE